MINYLEEQQPIQEQRSPGGYVRLAQKDDRPKIFSEDEFDNIVFPKKNVPHVGSICLRLVREQVNDGVEGDVWILCPQGLEKSSYQQVYQRRFYYVAIDLENPDIRFRESQFSVRLSLNGQDELVECDLENDIEEVEKHNKSILTGSDFSGSSWKTSDMNSSTRALLLYVSGDRKFLEDLYFRIIVAHPPQGGRNNGY